MSVIDLLRGRPSVDRVATIVGEADSLVDIDSAKALERLRELGPRPWFRAPDSQRIAYGFALRAFAAWRGHDMAAAKADMREAFTISPLADPLLPLVPVISDEEAGLSGLRARALVARFGGCGRESCEHPIGLEAAIGVISAADSAAEAVRWASRANGQELSTSLRIAAHGRAWQLGARAEAERALDGPGRRLLDARARVKHDIGSHGEVIGMLPPEHELAVRSALVLLLEGATVPEANRAVIHAQSQADQVVAALIAEAEGRYREAATAWRRAGQPLRAWEVDALSNPGDVGQPPSRVGLHRSTGWFAHAGGSAPRHATDPATDGDRHNAEVGANRDDLRAVREAGGLPLRHIAEPRVARLNQVLESITSGTAQASSLLATTTPDAPPPELLASLASCSRPHSDPGTSWDSWSRSHQDVAPLPRRAHPIRWLADRDGLAPPTSEDIAPLPHEQRLPVLAALVGTNASFAQAAASGAVTTEALRAALPQALPDLPALAAAVAGCLDLDPATRRRASVVACAALANGVVRGAWSSEAAEAATRRVTAAIADLLPDPDQMSGDEAFRIDSDALAAFPESTRRRAIGPVLRDLADLPLPSRLPKGMGHLYRAQPAHAAFLLAAGRPEAARRACEAGSDVDAALITGIAAAMADRHLSADRPVDALRELAAIQDPKELGHVDRDLLDRVAVAIVRNRRDDPVDDVLRDADRLLAALPTVPSVATMVVELLLARTAGRPGSAALDVPDLERAYEIDPDHPAVKRSLAAALVIRGIETVEARPTQAVADVDRATDLYMADAQLVEMASMVALRAGAILWGKQRNRGAAAAAIAVSLAINPHNTDALAARRIVRGY